jgi:hypothetical protein
VGNLPGIAFKPSEFEILFTHDVHTYARLILAKQISH